jgi:hypothetical protein
VKVDRLRVGLATVLFVASLFLAACGGASGGIGVTDAGSERACAGVREIVASGQGGSLQPAQLRVSLGQIYADAQSSANTLIKARALALYADATVAASGGQAPSLRADLQAMNQACAGQA